MTSFYSIGGQHCSDEIGHISDARAAGGYTLSWRYLKGEVFAMVNILPVHRDDAEGARWVFVHRDSLKRPLCGRASCTPTPNQ